MAASYYGGYTTTWSAAALTPTYVPYTPRDPRARTAVRFRVLVDPRAIAREETVRVTGDLAALTSWGAGVELARDAHDARIWR